MTKRYIVCGVLIVLGFACVVLLAQMPPFTPAGTVEIRSIDIESAQDVNG
jgi:hypothetical protein